MPLSDKTPLRLTQVSLLFSLLYLFLQGLSFTSLGIIAIFTLSVYACSKIVVLLFQLQVQTSADTSELQTYLFIAAGLFIGIATFAFSYLFGVFFVLMAAIYIISPYDRAWLAGQSKLVVYDNKVEYRNV